MQRKPFTIAMIGECMIELQEQADGAITMKFGGDTFNTAAYMARLGEDLGPFVSYVSAIGDDPYSDAMAKFWRDQGVSDDLVLRRPGKRPGLYIIKLEPSGERHFFYWRSDAAVRECFECDGSDALLQSLGRFSAIYLSGISIAVLKPASRERLFARLAELAAGGTAIHFDCNYRPLLWESKDVAKALYEKLFGFSASVLVTVEELDVVGTDVAHAADYFRRFPNVEAVIKDGAKPCTLIVGGKVSTVPAETVAQVVDTTAAGDSFSAAYILGRTLGLAPEEAAKRAHTTAAAVVRHRGAIIPKDATPKVFSAAEALSAKV
ncbi:2-dehydro-3-deoxygluconokinase [uncultured Alphaproteobacteria bacterium]|uniref:2-dehydro-3-deoxygluconokinase n=1 Tax=uncultured Alphaproteobacteria bacterium TaxID=91750 RepID=A0A212KMM0_9PROT|nr:2-dehydro-3-deoxygluconokinase [uncultured Alphaproteobacteria bacterium]